MKTQIKQRINMERGESGLTELVVLAGLLLVIVFYILPSHGINGPSENSLGLPDKYNEYKAAESASKAATAGNSVYTQGVTLGLGNARYETQPLLEYITLDNDSSAPVNITGWKLQNGKGERTYILGGQKQNYSSDSVSIPQAAGFISPSGYNFLSNVILAPGDEAIVTTGKMGVTTPYPIVSFKENKCSGYLGSYDSNYTFTPPLEQRCVRPADEPGVKNLDSSCQRYIESMNSCHTPKFDTRDTRGGDIVYGSVDGTVGLTTSCIAFIKERFNYAGCIATHKDDPNFYGKAWRIFLGNQWELWADKYETISLFDQFGKLVDSKSY